MAQELSAELGARLPGVPLGLHPTAFPGHGRALARAAEGRPLLVSISGDGGYNEVVNGAMDAGATAVCAVMGAGNANDHRRSTRTLPLAEAIVRGEVRRMDLLRLTVGEGPRAWSRYSHSYVGFGLTPLMAIGIEAGIKGRFTELVSVAGSLRGLAPIEVTRADGARAVLDSLILANIPRIAKYGRLSGAGYPDDGMFEVVILPHAARWRIGLMAFRAVTVGLGARQSVPSYSFTSTEAIPLQIDGEVMDVGAGTPVLVESAHQALATLG
ncbi:diacylglycerol kinase [Sinomonas sp. 5-5]|uniref:Diacylglycerol kinase n=2 Tax=Sinomonas terrae TaxID=2908838 RepID=A0ABS9U7T0_9MICC|nr:diacylglycerol kinase [Sinomonas terrae]